MLEVEKNGKKYRGLVPARIWNLRERQEGAIYLVWAGLYDTEGKYVDGHWWWADEDRKEAIEEMVERSERFDLPSSHLDIKTLMEIPDGVSEVALALFRAYLAGESEVVDLINDVLARGE